MKIESVEVIPFPRELVYRTLRDDLRGMIPYLPNIAEIQEREREELGGGVTRILNWWKAESDIPKVAKAFVTEDMLHWNDHATWHEADWTCEWRLETNFFTEAVSCSGRNTYTALDGDRTELAIRGDLTIDARKVRGVPKLLAGSVGPVIERFVVALIEPNFQRMNAGLVRYLEQQGG